MGVLSDRTRSPVPSPVMVVEPSVVGLKSARRLQHLFDRLGVPATKLALVVNRDGAKGCVARTEIERVVGRQVLAYLPNDSQAVMEAGNAGRPVVQDWPRSKWTKAVAALAKHLGNGHEARA